MKTTPRTPPALVGAGAILGAVLAATATLVALHGGSDSPCDVATPLRIVASPAVAPAIQEITKRDIDPACITIRVVAQNAADASAELAAGSGSDTPALWVPDSSLWPKLARQDAAAHGGTPPRIEERGALAMSPLVAVASRRDAAEFGWPDTRPGWQELIGGPVPTTIGDPLGTTEGLSTLMVVRQLLGNPDGTPRPELVGALLAVGRDAVSTMRAAYDRFGTASDAGLAFTASEQSVVTYNRAAGRTPVVAIYPREGTVAMDHPLVRVVRDGEPPEVGAAADAVEVVLRSASATATFQAAGFRAPDGTFDLTSSFSSATPGTGPLSGIDPARPTLVTLPLVEQATEVLRTWSAVTLDVRMLALIDVSGSMDAGSGAAGRTRIELARDAARTALQLYPDTTDVGLWAFSIQQAPPNDWAELVPMGRLGTAGHRAALDAAVTSLPSRTTGGTGLNDSVLAAYRALRDAYDPGRINSVVLLTDGRDEDPDGVDEDTLLRTLLAEADPARPVSVMAIGMGPDVDFAALQRIAAATGGKAYLASDPADIRGVFLDAIIRRR